MISVGVGRKVMLLNGRRFRQGDGQHDLILLAIEDITAQRLADAERGEIETRFTSLVKNIKVHAIITMDLDGRISTSNVEANRIFGYSEAEFVGQPFSLIFTPKDVQAGVPERELQTATATGRAIDERWHLRKDGGMFWALGIVTPTHDGRSSPIGYSKIVRDMTEQKIAEEQLRLAHEVSKTQVREKTAELKNAYAGLEAEIARRQQTEEAGRQAEARKAAVLDVSVDAIITMDHQGKVLEFNPAAVTMFGYQRADIIGQDMAELVMSPPLRERHRRGLAHYLATGEGPALGKRLELSAQRADGGEFPIELAIAHIPGPGQPVFIGFIRDVTERTRAEEALRTSEEGFRLMIDAIKDYAICTMDPAGRIATWNHGARRIYGYATEEIIGKDRSQLFGPDDVARGVHQRGLDEAAATGKSSEEGWRVRKDGSRFWANGTISALYNANGSLRGFVKVVRDLTERRRAEVSLRLRDRAMQAVSQGILITDPNQPDNPIIYASHGFERMTGYGSEEVLGKNCRLLQGAETNPEARAALREAIREERECSVELVNYRKDGTKFWNALFVTPVRDEDHRLANFVGVLVDVTERRNLEQAFQQSQKMEAVGQLAGGVAHDFNNLLTIISGYSEILLGRLRPDDPLREFIKAISDAGQRAASLTRQLLAFSRKTMHEPKVLNLNDVVAETEKMLRRLIGDDILLTTLLGPGISRIKIDPGLLDQVLMNLSVNARDAMPRGGKLTVETRNVNLDDHYAQAHASRTGNYVLLAVSDSGCGMTPAIKAHIFEPFFTTKGVGKGTGLGLAVVHGIVKQSGGYIEVYSEVDLGTTFKLYFPAIENKADAARAIDVSMDTRGDEAILLVEDNEGVRGLALLALQTQGYQVLVADDGNKALALIGTHSGTIDLLVTDVVMPGMGGGDLALALKAQYPNLKVLFTSGYTDDSVVRHGILEAEVAFLQKPYSPQSLARKVRQVLGQK